jgi:hypothetical protein
MNEQLQQLTRRTRQYWYIDGISELSFGGLCLLLALYFLSQALLPAESTLSSMLTTGFVLILVGAGLATRKLIHTLKSRLTYPRTGYVGYTHPNKNRRVLNMLVASFMGILIAALMAGAPISLEWIPGVSGLLFGAAWLYFGSRVGLVRFYLLAAFSALAGVSISLAHIPEDTGLAAYYALLGAAMLVSGGLTLWGYLRSTNLPEADSSGEEVQ